QTLIAAALQQSPNRRIVLLIDDPPAPSHRHDADRLTAMRELPAQIETLFAKPRRRAEEALAAYLRRRSHGSLDLRQEITWLTVALRETADFLDGLADVTPLRDHTDQLFVDEILRAPARAHRDRAHALETAPQPDAVDLLLEYRRMGTFVTFEIASF